MTALTEAQFPELKLSFKKRPVGFIACTASVIILFRLKQAPKRLKKME